MKLDFLSDNSLYGDGYIRVYWFYLAKHFILYWYHAWLPTVNNETFEGENLCNFRGLAIYQNHKP